MENLKIYEAVRTVPENALKPIKGGRLNGMSDINPMWRIKRLTEQFGPCGIGWKYEIEQMWLENGANGEIAAFAEIKLYIKDRELWSEAIPGVGGSSFVVNESKGPYTSDECYKMALTDALSVACKALGVGADVYYNKDTTKYTTEKPEQTAAPDKNPDPAFFCGGCGQKISKAEHDFSIKKYGKALCRTCQKTCAEKSKT